MKCKYRVVIRLEYRSPTDKDSILIAVKEIKTWDEEETPDARTYSRDLYNMICDFIQGLRSL